MRRATGLASLFACLALGHAAFGATGVTVSLSSVHPNYSLGVTGTGFANSEAIDVYVDTVDTTLVVSGATGTFYATALVPANAQPGKHHITAIGRRSGDAAQTYFIVSTPWQEQGFGAAGRGWNTWENTISTANVGTLGLLWAAPTAPVYSSPAVANGSVYVASPTGGVSSINVATGKVAWTTDPLNGNFYASPAVAGGRIIVASDAGGVAAVNTAGTKLWSALTTTDFSYASPVVVDGVVYVGDINGNIYALNAANGAKIWTYASAGEAIYSGAAVVNGIVYVGSYSGTVYALNAATGAVVWSYTTGGQIRGTPAVVNGVVYIGSFDGYVYGLAAAGSRGGSLLWKAQTDYNVWSSPAVADGAVFVAAGGVGGTTNGTVYAYNPRTGALKWSFAAGSGTFFYTDVSVANGVLYASSNDGTLYALDDSNGNLLWTGELGDAPWGRPLISDGVVYINSQSGSTFAFALQAGNDAVRPVRPPSISSLHPDYHLQVELKN
jgi:outer membrane protein assembly factor BamB